MTTAGLPIPDRPLVLRGPADLVAAVPYRLGFHPADSLVLVEVPPAADGCTSRLGALVRGDLPAGTSSAALAAAVDPVLDRCRVAAGPDASFVLLAYDPDAEVHGEPLTPGRRAGATLERVERSLVAAGRTVHDVLLVTPQRWRSLRCAGRCCPAAGTPLRGAGHDRIAAEAVGLGLSAAPGRAAVLPPVHPAAEDSLRAAEAVRRRTADRGWTPAAREQLCATWWGLVDARCAGRSGHETVAAVSPQLCGQVLAAAVDVGTRDALLLGVDDEPRAGTRTVPAVAAGLAVDVARHGTGEPAAGTWAMAAWWYWSAGDPVRSGACAQQALRHDPDHRLAVLVRQAVRWALPPRPRPGA